MPRTDAGITDDGVTDDGIIPRVSERLGAETLRFRFRKQQVLFATNAPAAGWNSRARIFLSDVHMSWVIKVFSNSIHAAKTQEDAKALMQSEESDHGHEASFFWSLGFVSAVLMDLERYRRVTAFLPFSAVGKKS